MRTRVSHPCRNKSAHGNEVPCTDEEYRVRDTILIPRSDVLSLSLPSAAALAISTRNRAGTNQAARLYSN